MCVFVLVPVCLCVRGPYPNGHGEQSRALSNHSWLSKAGQEGKGIVWDCFHNKSAFKVRVKDISSDGAMRWELIKKKFDLLQLPALMSYPWLCIYGVKRGYKHICTEIAVVLMRQLAQIRICFSTAEKLRKVPTLNVNVPFCDPSLSSHERGHLNSCRRKKKDTLLPGRSSVAWVIKKKHIFWQFEPFRLHLTHWRNFEPAQKWQLKI